MPYPIFLRAPELLHISDHGVIRYGANQEWYPTIWQRKAGCGPTVCSHLLWYLAKTRKGCEALCRHDATRREGFLELMKEVWHYVTPGLKGVNTTAIFSEGVSRYGAEKGVDLSCEALEVPALSAVRPRVSEVMGFLVSILKKDLPAAFLNLSNGELKNLDSWHWVTLVAADPGKGTVMMLDQGSHREIDLALWLKTTTLGGGFVCVEAAT